MAVRVEHFALTLTGAAQAVAHPTLPTVRIRALSLQPAPANTGPIYLGGNGTLDSSTYGVRIPAPVAGLPPAPFILGEFEDGSCTLEDFRVIGTLNEVLQVLLIRYE